MERKTTETYIQVRIQPAQEFCFYFGVGFTDSIYSERRTINNRL